MLAHVDFQSDAKSLQPDSLLKLRAAWGAAGKPMDNAVGYYLGANADATEAAATLAQSQAIMGALDGNVSDVNVRNAADLDKVTACRGITVLVSRPAAVATQILIARPDWDGRFFFNADTQIELVKLTDGVPDDENALMAIVRKMLARQPTSLGIGIKTSAGKPEAEPVGALIDAVVKKIGFAGLSIRDVPVLQQQETDDLAARGFPPDSYAQAVLFAGQRPAQ